MFCIISPEFIVADLLECNKSLVRYRFLLMLTCYIYSMLVTYHRYSMQPYS